ncbi:MAG: thiamine diphosphokinase [Acidimicrobiia bacterium]
MKSVVVFAGGEPIPSWSEGEIPDDAYLIAADSGLDQALSLGLDVDLVVGDMDSVGEDALRITTATLERYSPDKDATDLELALQAAMERDPLQVTVLGGQGGRFDHLMGTMMLLTSERWAGVELEWVASRARVRIVRAGTTLHGAAGSTLTLLAVAGPVRQISTTGLRWNLSDETLWPGSTRGVSNVFAGPVATVRLDSGTLVAIQPDPA